jgi:hypothetical protein
MGDVIREYPKRQGPTHLSHSDLIERRLYIHSDPLTRSAAIQTDSLFSFPFCSRYSCL